jgi:hypothetical protein
MGLSCCVRHIQKDINKKYYLARDISIVVDKIGEDASDSAEISSY